MDAGVLECDSQYYRVLFKYIDEYSTVIGLEHETLSLNTFLLEFPEKSSPSTKVLF